MLGFYFPLNKLGHYHHPCYVSVYMIIGVYSSVPCAWSLSFRYRLSAIIYLFGVLCRFQRCTGHMTTGSWEGRGNQYIQLVKVLYCKLPTNGKQLPAFPLEVGSGTEPRSQRWEARVLPLCHRRPRLSAIKVLLELESEQTSIAFTKGINIKLNQKSAQIWFKQL